MIALALVMRVVVSAAFFAAAFGKILTPGSTRAIIDTYELDPRLAPVVRILPLVEAALGTGALFAATSRAAGIGACALLVIFSASIVRNLRRGRRGDCNCFGRLHASKIGWRPLFRNGVLIFASAWTALRSQQPSASLMVRNLDHLFSDLWVDAAVGLGALALGIRLMKRNNRGLPAESEVVEVASASQPTLPADERVPEEQLTTLNGDTLSLQRFDVLGSHAILIFVDPECGPCRTVVPVLKRWWDAVSHNKLVVVSSGPVDRTREFLAGIPEERVVLDEDFALARRFGVNGTPSAVRIPADISEAHSIVTGPMAIEILLRQSADPARSSRLLPSSLNRLGIAGRRRSLEARGADSVVSGTALSRREVLTAAVVGAGLALAMTAFGSGPSGASTTEGTTCPSCGTCIDCDWNTSTGALKCHPCKKSCSNAELCTGYANKNSNYRKLQTYLQAHGYSQNGAPTASGLTKNGSQAFLALTTAFASRSRQSPKALLLYQLTNAGEGSAALILDRKGMVASVVTVNAAGRLVTGAVPPPPSSAKTAAATSADSEPTVSLTAASCNDVCGQAWKLVVLSFEVALATEPLGLAVLLASYALPNLGETGESAANSLSVLNVASEASSLAGLAYGLVKDKASDKLKDFDQNVVCNAICNIKLKACCNYTGACFDSDAKCESLCPGGLAHPMAHCDVYINGKKVSSLIPGGV